MTFECKEKPRRNRLQAKPCKFLKIQRVRSVNVNFLPPLLDLLQALTLLLQKRRKLLETKWLSLNHKKTANYGANYEKSSYKTRLEMQFVVSDATSAVQSLEYTSG
jgi:hypothetical protein